MLQYLQDLSLSLMDVNPLIFPKKTWSELFIIQISDQETRLSNEYEDEGWFKVNYRHWTYYCPDFWLSSGRFVED
jgi:hypothetical protein